ncbi:winged helix-turn-helix domain-containing protein [Pseudomonas sp. RT6P73]
MLTNDNVTSSENDLNTYNYFITFLDGQQHARFTPSKHQIIIHDGSSAKNVELSYTSSRILELLILKADVIVSREEIFSFAWPRRVVGQNSLNQAISNIRELFHDDDHRAIIQTFPRRGYRFNSAFLCNDPEPSCFVDMKECHSLPLHGPAPTIEPPQAIAAEPDAPAIRPSVNFMLATLLAVLLGTFIWRIDWLLFEQSGLSVIEESTGDLTTIYAIESEEELTQIKNDLRAVHTRLMSMVNRPETVIFNRMHSFYEITCIDSGTNVKFLTVHRKQLGTLTTEQLKGCLE